MSNNDLPGSYTTGTVPVPEAMKWTENWRNYLDTAETEFVVRSFLIPITSFKNMLANNPDAEAVRAYLGLSDANDATTSQIVFIPVVDGKEVPYLPTKGDNNGDTVKNPDDDSNIYDYAKACPPDCGNGGGLDG